MKKLISAAFALVIFAGLTACGTSSDNLIGAEKGSAANPIRFGVVGLADDQWQILKDDLAAQGIFIEYSNFTEYNVGLDALNEGSLDINQSVHTLLLSNYNVTHGTNLRAIGSKAVFLLGLYPNKSKGITSVADFKQGDEVLVPNDASNLARALLELQDSGLVELRDGGSPFSTEADVLPGSKVKIRAVEATAIPALLDDPNVAAGVANNDHIRPVGISPSESIIRVNMEGDVAQWYNNVFVVAPDQVDNPLYKRLVEIATHDQRWLDEVLDESGHTATVTTDITPDQLASIQDDLQVQIAAR